jgi:hypothetical protein
MGCQHVLTLQRRLKKDLAAASKGTSDIKGAAP